MHPKKVVIAGGSGFLGTNLASELTDLGCRVVVLSRRPPSQATAWDHAIWDGRQVGPWAQHLDGADALVNLVGRTVDCIKTPDHCDEILRSRVESTEVLGAAMARADQKPPAWVQMSTAHIYGDPSEDVLCDEDSAFGYGLAPDVGRAWEAAFERSLPDGVRGVVCRTSFVLGRGAGAMPRLAKVARLGFGGTVGHGRQGMSWIHERDMNRLLVRAITDTEMRGAYVMSSPNPVSNAKFMAALRRALGVKIGLPAATWMVRIGAPLFLRTDPALAIYGRYVVSRRLRQEGFDFSVPDLEAAFADLY
jgi:uncharacterized protein (TIGR01777 family)